MRRTMDQWRGMKADAIMAGSPAQMRYCIEDAQADIIQLHAEVTALRRERDALRAALNGAVRILLGRDVPAAAAGSGQ